MSFVLTNGEILHGNGAAEKQYILIIGDKVIRWKVGNKLSVRMGDLSFWFALTWTYPMLILM